MNILFILRWMLNLTGATFAAISISCFVVGWPGLGVIYAFCTYLVFRKEKF